MKNKTNKIEVLPKTKFCKGRTRLDTIKECQEYFSKRFKEISKMK